MLGYPWFVSGEVVHGDKRGRELGYPTANLRLDPTCGLRHGIYAVRVDVGGARMTAWRVSAAARCSTSAPCCSKCSCSIFPATSTGRRRRGVHRMDQAGDEIRDRRRSGPADGRGQPPARAALARAPTHFRRWAHLVLWDSSLSGAESACYIARHVNARTRLQRDAVPAEDRLPDARRPAAEGAGDSRALGEARHLRAAARSRAGATNSSCTTARPTPTATSTSATRSTRS